MQRGHCQGTRASHTPRSYDDAELAQAAAGHACGLLDSGAMTPSQMVPLLWAFGLQVCMCARVWGAGGVFACLGAAHDARIRHQFCFTIAPCPDI